MLPALESSKTYRRIEEDFTKGIWHRRGGKDGSFYDCENISGEQHPVIAPRPPRRRWFNLSDGVLGMHCSDALYLACDGELLMSLSENRVQVLGQVNNQPKVFGSLGNNVLVLPDMKVYDISNERLASKSVKLLLANVLVHNQDYVDEDGVARTIRRNTLHCVDFNFADYFKPGDSLRIVGTKSNNGYFTVREVEEFDLHFDEYAFVAEDIPSCYLIKDVPALKGICTADARLWGYTGNTIYACAPGEVVNWYRYDGDAQSSYKVTVADKGAFTGCVMHAGRPVFFKTNCMVEVLGDSPENFTVVQTSLSGVAQGSGASLCSVGGNMLYLSENGVISCSGSNAKVISEALGQRLSDGVATTDGRRYYLCATNESGARGLYIYDTELDSWHREDGANIVYLGYLNGDIYAYCSNNTVYMIGKDTTGNGTPLESAQSFTEFHPLCDDARGEIVPVRLGLRVWCDADSSLTLYVCYDGGEWEQRATLENEGERLWYVPLQPRACHSLGVRVAGTGNYRICSLVREYK